MSYIKIEKRQPKRDATKRSHECNELLCVHLCVLALYCLCYIFPSQAIIEFTFITVVVMQCGCFVVRHKRAI